MLFLSGVRFRRQHWCLLSVVLLIIVLSVAIGLPLSGEDLPLTAEEQAAVVKQLLKEVPLIDGWENKQENRKKAIVKIKNDNVKKEIRLILITSLIFPKIVQK